MPMPVLRHIDKKYVIFAGNHRMPGAKRAGLSTVTAYVFSSNDDFVIKHFQRALNAPNKAVTRNERLVFAYEAVLDGMSSKSAATIWSLNRSSIYNYTRGEQTRNDLYTKMGVSGATRLSNCCIQQLAKIKNTNVLKATGQLACDSKMGGDEAGRLVSEIIAEKTEASQLSVVYGARKLMEIDGQNEGTKTISTFGKRRPDSTKAVYAVGILEKLANARSISQWGITDRGKKAEIIARMRKLIKAIEAICKRSDA
jgi:hypothetical protein